MSVFDDLSSLAPHRVVEGIAARVVPGERATFAVIELDPNSIVPEHSHENEQIGVLASGSLRFRIGGEERTLEPGATWSIPADVPHEAVAGADGAVAIEIFVPRRDDWDALERREPSESSWPVRSGRL